MDSSNIKKKKRSIFLEGKLDITMLSFILLLLTIGLVMLFSASYAYSYEYYKNSYKFISRQAAFAAGGLALMFFISKIDYRFWRKFAWAVFFVSTGLLILLLAIPPMVSGMDVKRWIVVGPLNFQPSEIAKFSIILLFSSLIAANQKLMTSFKFILFLGAILGLTCVLIVLEPHISATVLVFAIGVTLLFIGGMQKRWIIGGAAAGLGAVGLAIATKLISYGSDRIKYWRDPWLDASGKGFQTIQSLLAIGSGGLLGRGIGQSRQKYLWVPEPHNDFIFSIV